MVSIKAELLGAGNARFYIIETINGGDTMYSSQIKNVTCIGCGTIGSSWALNFAMRGLNVIAYDKYPNSNVNAKYVPLNELLSQSDIISLHCPLTEETYRLINKDSIEKLKKGVAIINTSRGGLIDAEALLEGIKSRKIGAACLDVYEEESELFFEDKSGHIMDDDTLARLISMPNVIVTSHQAFLTEEALKGIAETTTQNIVSFINSGECENKVCYKCM